MDKKFLRKFMVSTLIFIILMGAVGCKKEEEKKVEEKPKQEEKEEVKVGELANSKLKNLEFSLNLLKNTYTFRQNSVLAPMSVQMALATALNGSEGSTQQCIIKAMGMETIRYNEYIKTYFDTLDEEDANSLIYANSIWFNNITGNMGVNSNFQSRAKGYLYTDIELLVFNSYTKDALNSWISTKTNGFIESLYVRSSTTDVMYMINAAVFNMDWQESYGTEGIQAGTFTNINKTVSNVEMMSSVEKMYIEDNNATGFVKNYANPRYQFVAILPDQSTNVYAYLKALSTNSLNKMLMGIKKEEVKVTIPKFDGTQTLNLQNCFTKMGMTSLFSDKAQYTGFLKNGNNIPPGKYYHKSRVEVGKTATQAGGIATVSNTKTNEASREIVLNRPFIYMIYDSYHCIPIFIGVQQLMP